VQKPYKQYLREENIASSSAIQREPILLDLTPHSGIKGDEILNTWQSIGIHPFNKN
jgi:hypothetical protein